MQQEDPGILQQLKPDCSEDSTTRIGKGAACIYAQENEGMIWTFFYESSGSVRVWAVWGSWLGDFDKNKSERDPRRFTYGGFKNYLW